ncbi:MAG: ATP synthase subunit C family protein [Janthinobacterium lividum]|nr:MAG: F0F1 ATP synthase subunit C [Alphaproteobacteria bacterium]
MDPQSVAVSAAATVAAYKALGAGIAVIALAGVGLGMGSIFSAMVTSVARNPSARDVVFPIGILGFALTEAVALFALLIAFLILFT